MDQDSLPNNLIEGLKKHKKKLAFMTLAASVLVSCGLSLGLLTQNTTASETPNFLYTYNNGGPHPDCQNWQIFGEPTDFIYWRIGRSDTYKDQQPMDTYYFDFSFSNPLGQGSISKSGYIHIQPCSYP